MAAAEGGTGRPLLVLGAWDRLGLETALLVVMLRRPEGLELEEERVLFAEPDGPSPPPPCPPLGAPRSPVGPPEEGGPPAAEAEPSSGP